MASGNREGAADPAMRHWCGLRAESSSGTGVFIPATARRIASSGVWLPCAAIVASVGAASRSVPHVGADSLSSPGTMVPTRPRRLLRSPTAQKTIPTAIMTPRAPRVTDSKKVRDTPQLACTE